MASQSWWVVAITAWPRPDAKNSLIIKLTRSQPEGTDSRAVTAPAEACSVLLEWLAEREGSESATLSN